LSTFKTVYTAVTELNPDKKVYLIPDDDDEEDINPRFTTHLRTKQPTQQSQSTPAVQENNQLKEYINGQQALIDKLKYELELANRQAHQQTQPSQPQSSIGPTQSYKQTSTQYANRYNLFKGFDRCKLMSSLGDPISASYKTDTDNSTLAYIESFKQSCFFGSSRVNASPEVTCTFATIPMDTDYRDLAYLNIEIRNCSNEELREVNVEGINPKGSL
jgi:hypothetical protein